MSGLDIFFFVALPYVAIFVFLIGTIYRYKSTGFGVSSLSSQFLEGKTLFFGSVPFHFGLLFVLLSHLWFFFFPKTVIAWNSQPGRLIALEVVAFSFAVSIFIGLIGLLYRRISNPRIHAVTSKMDVAVELLLLLQVVLGCWVALGYRWGSSWFSSDLSPYLWSIFKLNPQIDAVASLPFVVKLHIIGAFSIFLIFPFTRLVHIVVAPFHYIFRPYQVVMWNWDKKTIRSPSTAWSEARPKNN